MNKANEVLCRCTPSPDSDSSGGRQKTVGKNVFSVGNSMKFITIHWVAVMQILAALVMSSSALADFRGDAVLGVWFTPDSESQVEIYHCANNNYCGKVIWLKEPNFLLDDDKPFAGKLKVDRYNPDEQRQNDPVVGKEILQGLFYSEDSLWHDGEIYDPKNGKTYQCKATITSDGKLEIRGFIGISLIGRTSVWTRRSS